MKKIIGIMVFLICIYPVIGYAETYEYGYLGTESFEDNSFSFSASDTGDAEILSFTYSSCSDNGEITYYENVNQDAVEMYSETLPKGESEITTPGGTTTIFIESHDGKEIFLKQAITNNPGYEEVIFEMGNCLNETIPEEEGGSGDGSYEQLITTTHEVKLAVQRNGGKLDLIKESIRNNGVKLDSINTVLQTISDQLTPQTDITTPSNTGNMTTPTAPDQSNTLDNNRPNQPTESFTDDKDYFIDQGDTSENYTSFPEATEPNDWEGYTQEEQLTPEEEITQDSELTKESERTKEPELEKEEMTQEPQLEREEMTSSPELNQDTELNQDSELNQDNELTKEPEPTQDTPMEQTETDHELRWKSADRN